MTHLACTVRMIWAVKVGLRKFGQKVRLKKEVQNTRMAETTSLQNEINKFRHVGRRVYGPRNIKNLRVGNSRHSFK